MYITFTIYSYCINIKFINCKKFLYILINGSLQLNSYTKHAITVEYLCRIVSMLADIAASHLAARSPYPH